jgi:hypothetical protein
MIAETAPTLAPIIGGGPEQELFVTWTGPYAWPGFERDGLPALPNHGGV